MAGARWLCVSVALLTGLCTAEDEVQLDELDSDFEKTAQEEVKSLAQYLTQEEVYWPPGGDPLCPPPPRPLKADLCDVKRCDDDSTCTDNEACCYNGCVYTCTKKLEPPPFFDWLEESPNHLVGNKTRWATSSGDGTDHVLTPEEMVALPGGCLLTSRQYADLEGFRENKHVKKCYCDKGGVFCEVVRDGTDK